MSAISVARVTRVGDLIVNTELATQEWLDAADHDPWFYFVEYGEGLKGAAKGVPVIGLHYDPAKKEFEEPHDPEHKAAAKPRARKKSEPA